MRVRVRVRSWGGTGVCAPGACVWGVTRPLAPPLTCEGALSQPPQHRYCAHLSASRTPALCVRTRPYAYARSRRTRPHACSTRRHPCGRSRRTRPDACGPVRHPHATPRGGWRSLGHSTPTWLSVVLDPRMGPEPRRAASRPREAKGDTRTRPSNSSRPRADGLLRGRWGVELLQRAQVDRLGGVAGHPPELADRGVLAAPDPSPGPSLDLVRVAVPDLAGLGGQRVG